MGNNLETIVYLLNSLDPKRRNHIIGGVLLGVSMFFRSFKHYHFDNKSKGD